jgi:hypothetical protein
MDFIPGFVRTGNIKAANARIFDRGWNHYLLGKSDIPGGRILRKWK